LHGEFAFVLVAVHHEFPPIPPPHFAGSEYEVCAAAELVRPKLCMWTRFVDKHIISDFQVRTLFLLSLVLLFSWHFAIFLILCCNPSLVLSSLCLKSSGFLFIASLRYPAVVSGEPATLRELIWSGGRCAQCQRPPTTTTAAATTSRVDLGCVAAGVGGSMERIEEQH
jgi:hypothetical protein